MRKILLLITGFIVIILLTTVAINILQQHAKTSAIRKTADTFVTYALKGDGDKTYAMLVPNTQKNLVKSDWDLQIAKLSGFFYKQQPLYVSTSSGGSTFTINYSIKGTDGIYAFTVIIVQSTDKAWQVQQFTSTLGS